MPSGTSVLLLVGWTRASHGPGLAACSGDFGSVSDIRASVRLEDVLACPLKTRRTVLARIRPDKVLDGAQDQVQLAIYSRVITLSR